MGGGFQGGCGLAFTWASIPAPGYDNVSNQTRNSHLSMEIMVKNSMNILLSLIIGLTGLAAGWLECKTITEDGRFKLTTNGWLILSIFILITLTASIFNAMESKSKDKEIANLNNNVLIRFSIESALLVQDRKHQSFE